MRASASSMSPATPSSTSPMKRSVRWRLPGSTHLAPGTPPARSDRRRRSSGGKAMPTNSRIIGLILWEDRQHAGIGIEPVVRDFPVAEESDEREIAERLADKAELVARAREKIGAARDAAEIEAAPRYPGAPVLDAFQHSLQVGDGARGVAPAEEDRVAGR